MTSSAQTSMKRILFIEELSVLIGKAATTIRTCATNRKYAHLIPRPFKLPRSRRLAWYEEDVLVWLEASTPVEPVTQRRRRGRPTKTEEIARRAEANARNALP